MKIELIKKDSIFLTRKEKLFLLLCFCFAFYCVLVFLIKIFPHLGFRYDIEPTDGDKVNVVERLCKGLPIYNNWKDGYIYTNYSPLWFYLLTIPRLLGIDVAIFGRVANGLFVMLSGLWHIVSLLSL
jgi:hypothetical protein